jgi:predicted N-acetyltransferase YhbS
MIAIRRERPADVSAREALLDLSFGRGRFDKTSERLREGRRPADRLSFVAIENGRVVGTVRLWHISTGAGRPALLLGPLAVAPDRRKRGLGAALMRRAIRDARRLGHHVVVLVGDAPYYQRFGFTAAKTDRFWLPGPYEADRLLALELTAGALEDAHGLVNATGALLPRPKLAPLVARAKASTAMPSAA